MDSSEQSESLTSVSQSGRGRGYGRPPSARGRGKDRGRGTHSNNNPPNTHSPRQTQPHQQGDRNNRAFTRGHGQSGQNSSRGHHRGSHTRGNQQMNRGRGKNQYPFALQGIPAPDQHLTRNLSDHPGAQFVRHHPQPDYQQHQDRLYHDKLPSSQTEFVNRHTQSHSGAQFGTHHPDYQQNSRPTSSVGSQGLFAHTPSPGFLPVAIRVDNSNFEDGCKPQPELRADSGMADTSYHDQRPYQRQLVEPNYPLSKPGQPITHQLFLPTSDGDAHPKGSIPSPLIYICSSGRATKPSDERTVVVPNMSLETILSGSFGHQYLEALRSLVISSSLLEDGGYKTRALTDDELLDRRRCMGCDKYWGKVRKLQARQDAKQEHLGNSTSSQNQPTGDALQTNRLDLICHFHTGKIVTQRAIVKELRLDQAVPFERVWSCCSKPPASEPCSGAERHIPGGEDLVALEAQWQSTGTTPGYRSTHRTAVAIDCEMGTSKANNSELIRITLVDYFTTEVLIDSLVFPSVPMAHLNTKYSGVTWPQLNAAKQRGKCIHGRKAALEKVFEFVGSETIVVAHSGSNDLSSLRWRHDRIIDTHVAEDAPHRAHMKLLKKQAEIASNENQRARNEEFNRRLAAGENSSDIRKSMKALQSTQAKDTNLGQADLSIIGSSLSISKDVTDKDTPAKAKEPRIKSSGPFSLKTLTRTRLGRDIQVGNQGHDSLEDAIATRDLAHWLVRCKLEDWPVEPEKYAEHLPEKKLEDPADT